jgi:hypothetical protein
LTFLTRDVNHVTFKHYGFLSLWCSEWSRARSAAANISFSKSTSSSSSTSSPSSRNSTLHCVPYSCRNIAPDRIPAAPFQSLSSDLAAYLHLYLTPSPISISPYLSASLPVVAYIPPCADLHFSPPLFSLH